MKARAQAEPRIDGDETLHAVWLRIRWPVLDVAHRSPWMVAGVTLAVYGVWLASYLLMGYDARDFTASSTVFLARSDASTVIHVDPSYHYARSPLGYDGQFCYYIALDPLNARYYIDVPSYRYERILYPLLARLFALGQPTLIPYTLLLINWLAIGGGTAALALWLRRRECSPWLALLFGLYPGLVFAMQRDLTEPLGYALVAVAVYLFDFGGRRRILWAGIAFAFAGLARETTVVFAGIYAAVLLWASIPHDAGHGWRACISAISRSHWRPAVLLLGLSVVPLALFKVFLVLWLGSTGTPTTSLPVLVPFAGLLAWWPWQGQQILVLEGYVLPALLVTGLALVALARRQATAPVWALLANALLFVVLLNPSSYELTGSGRAMSGVVLAALLCVPGFAAAVPHARVWLVVAGALWLTLLPLWIIFPFVTRP